jgi:hypothetical protein
MKTQNFKRRPLHCYFFVNSLTTKCRRAVDIASTITSKKAAAFIVGLMPAELRPKEGGRCCIHRRAEAAPPELRPKEAVLML